jgi:pimeloyl-ACP methyl ester carboxylesterase
MRVIRNKLTAALLGPVVLAAVVAVPAPAGTGPGLAWGPCPGGAGTVGIECASLSVPVDWAKPAGRKITLMLGRLAYDGPRQASGSVLANFGAGAPGISFLRDILGPEPFARLRHEMNIVTWDPRGYTNGLSTHLPCEIRHRVEPALPRNQAEFDQIAADNRSIAETCRDRDPELFDSVGTATHAKDMEAIRRALGESKVNLYMGSYGGAFGQAYARLYPHRIRTMVLDGVGNMTDIRREDIARARDGEVRMRRFVDWCASTSSCALHGVDVPRLWQGLVARADRSPVQAPDGTVYDGVALQIRAVGYLSRGGPGLDLWFRFAQAIADADRGDVSGFAAVPPLGGPSPDIIACQDFPRHANHAAMASTIDLLRRIAPNTGAAGTTAIRLACLGYPTPVTFPSGPVPAGVPPLLGVEAWEDPGTSRAVQQVRGSVTIYHDGLGHELYIQNNACVIGHVNRYFTTKALPPTGTECP